MQRLYGLSQYITENYPANISGLAKGVYIVDIYNKQGQKSVAKLVVE